MGKDKLVPKLRFPEFKDELDIKRLGEIGIFLGGGTPSRSDEAYWQGNIPWISSSDLSEDSIHTINIHRYITERAIQDSATKLLPENTILIVSRVGVGKIAITKNPVCTSQDFTSFKPLQDNIAFLAYYLKSKQDTLLGFSQGMAIKGFTKEDISNLSIYLPPIKEQQKIADCLTSLDELITAENEKLDALKTHKKGLMQQLFPREGESTPRLRFPEFKDAGEWEARKLGQIGDVLMCKRIFAHDTNSSSGVPFYKIGTLGNKPDAFISKVLFDEYKEKYNFPRVGEVLITCSGTVGKCLPYDGQDAYFQDSNIVWIDNPDLTVTNEFLHILLLNVDWGKLNSTTITRIYGSDLRGLIITFPSTKEEQQKITNVISSIDDQITTQTEKLESLNQHKKGLMQQLFPMV